MIFVGLDEMMGEFEKQQQIVSDQSNGVNDDELSGVDASEKTACVGLEEMMYEFEQQHGTHVVDEQSMDSYDGVIRQQLNEGNDSEEDPKEMLPNLALVDASGSLEGVIAEKLEELEELYQRHSRHVGFSVRKATQRGGQVRPKEKYFVCACERHSTPSLVDASPSKRKRKKRVYPHTRVGCKANIRCKLDKHGRYRVMHHNVFHNHALTRIEWQHLHRSERKITNETAKAITSFEDVGIGPTDSYRYWSNDAGGDEHVGHTLEDHINFVNRLRMKIVEGGDAETVVNLLSEEATNDPDFFFRVRTDESGRLVSLFWCDSMMREDYKIYGDVLIFDTTYRTNRYNLICAPFVGVNNHWKNVMFGCAFIADEKIESFVWLLETFKEAMSNKSPTTIFTDQDHAIANAIQQVFPESRHRLCLWHLQKNAVSHFGTLRTCQGFKEAFNKCLSGCSNEEEFQTCWDNMVATYELERNPNYPWFTRVYDIRNKWCTALSKDFFSAGILSSKRSESTNNALGFQANKATSLTQFYKLFKHTITRWRKNELKLEFYCSKSQPHSDFALSGLLKHASQVYTSSLFRDFEEEFKVAIGSFARKIWEDEREIAYKVAIEESFVSSEVVTYGFLNDPVLISCSCKNFEECGWLCCHCIRILHMHSVTRIPPKYILQRWTKMAKKEVWDRLYGGEPGETSNPKLLTIPWRHEMARKFYNLILKSQKSVGTRLVIEEVYKKALEAVEQQIGSTLDTTEADTSEANETRKPATAEERVSTVLDPTRSTTKGRSKRIKGHFNRRKRSSSSTSSQLDFSNFTPNRHLI
ncbi:protein FAR1-RELATED SEQUENCE 5-like [Silene latifolia]|uniref:protein FAR1-RELATED SEQUENCE 5-like n=1 Tax=Silene latifolia TaxID=37657 RepID=UPI003D76C80D